MFRRTVALAALVAVTILPGCSDNEAPLAPQADGSEQNEPAEPGQPSNYVALTDLPYRHCPYELKEGYIQLLRSDASWSQGYLKFAGIGSTIPTAENSSNRTKVKGVDGGLQYQCVDFVECVAGVSYTTTSNWIQGIRALSAGYVPTGTVVARFANGHYDGHVGALYSRSSSTISLWDQNYVVSNFVGRHVLSSNGGGGVSDAGAYYVVRLNVSFGAANFNWDCLDDATPANQRVTMSRGQVRSFRVSVKDMGSAMWSQNGAGPNQVYLAACTSSSESSSPNNRASAFAYQWIDGTNWKPALPTKTVSQNEYAVYDFKMKAPQTNGDYTEKFYIYACADGNGLWIPRTDAPPYRVVSVLIRVVN